MRGIDAVACRDRLTCKDHGAYISDETLRKMGYIPIEQYEALAAIKAYEIAECVAAHLTEKAAS